MYSFQLSRLLCSSGIQTNLDSPHDILTSVSRRGNPKASGFEIGGHLDLDCLDTNLGAIPTLGRRCNTSEIGETGSVAVASIAGKTDSHTDP